MVNRFKAHVSRDGKTRSMDGVEGEEVACQNTRDTYRAV